MEYEYRFQNICKRPNIYLLGAVAQLVLYGAGKAVTLSTVEWVCNEHINFELRLVGGLIAIVFLKAVSIIAFSFTVKVAEIATKKNK